MTIDEAIIKIRVRADEHSGCWKGCTSHKPCKICQEEHKQLADWLEELKANRIALEKANGYLEANYRLGYSKAIDDLLGGMNQITYNCQDADELFEKICDLAEQLKAGESE